MHSSVVYSFDKDDSGIFSLSGFFETMNLTGTMNDPQVRRITGNSFSKEAWYLAIEHMIQACKTRRSKIEEMEEPYRSNLLPSHLQVVDRVLNLAEIGEQNIRPVVSIP